MRILVFFIISCLTMDVKAQCRITAALRENGHILLGEIMPCDYVKEFPPPRKVGEPVEVECALYVQDITSFNAQDMDFRIDMIFYMSWEDARLSLGNSSLVEAGSVTGQLSLSSYALDYIWMPDPYITNSKDAAISKLTTVYASLAVHRNHTLRYKARVFSLISCQMSFQKYPMDVQTCYVSFQSFKFSNQQLKLKWRSHEPVTMNPALKLLQFEVEMSRNFVTNKTFKDFGGYGERTMVVLTVEFKFYRLIGHHVVQTYIPSSLMVALTWFSFWIGLDAIPGRVTLLVTSLLNITTLFSGVSRNIPAVAYVKAIDIWMAGCIIFAFAAVGEFVICKVIKVFHEKHKAIPINDGSRPRSYPSSQTGNLGDSPLSFNRNNNNHPSSINNNNNNKGDPTFGGQFSSHTGPPSHTTYNQPWPPSGDVERGLRSEVMTNRLKRFNARDVDMTRNITFVRAVHPSLSSNSDDNKRPREVDGRSRESSSEWGQLMAGNRTKRRRKWIKTIRDLEMQWNDPKTGDTKILWEEIDSTSRVLFPCVFFVFAAIYFPLLIML